MTAVRRRPAHGCNRRQALLSLGAAAASAGLAACTHSEPLLRVASNVWPGYELMHAAQALGRLDDAHVRVIEMASSTQVLQALASGAIEGGGLTLDELLSARAEGLDLCAVLVFDESQGADALMVRPAVTGLAALAGRRIGVEQSAVGALVLNAALASAGLSLAQVRPVFLTVDQHLQAWQAGEIDALVSFEPVLSAVAAQGGRRLFDSRSMPGAIVDLLAVQKSVLQRSPQALRQLLQAHFDLRTLWEREPQTLAPTIGARMGLRPEQVQATFGGISMPDLHANHRWLGGPQPLLKDAATALQALMLQARLLPRLTPLDGLGNVDCLPALPREGVE